jgi:hypothetical protein
MAVRGSTDRPHRVGAVAEHPAVGVDRDVRRQLVGEPAGRWGTALDMTGTVALAFWAIDEIFRGVNPWRRILGAGVFVFLAIRLLALV